MAMYLTTLKRADEVRIGDTLVLDGSDHFTVDQVFGGFGVSFVDPDGDSSPSYAPEDQVEAIERKL